MDTILSSETINYKFCPQCQTSKPDKKFKRNQDWCRQCIKEAQAQTPQGKKFCLYCKETKDIELFKVDSRLQDGRKSICKACHSLFEHPRRMQRPRGYSVGLNYGITLDYYELLLQEQEGVCAACGYPETAMDHRTQQIRRLAVDHNHKTGEVRGLLCTSCNLALGNLLEDPARIEGLLKYILKYIA